MLSFVEERLETPDALESGMISSCFEQ